MSHYSKTQTPIDDIGEIHCYVGAPDCATFYQWILRNLEDALHPGFGPPIPPLVKLTTGQAGNLGEAITWLVGYSERFSNFPYYISLGGALTPFNPGAITGVDIIVVYLDSNGIMANDRLFIQEIKTTGLESLEYSKALIEDYQKLLDTTKPTLSLMSRVSAFKAKLKYEHRLDVNLLQRVEELVQPTAAACDRVVLMPTLIHDRNCNAIAALSNVMIEIQKQGWTKGSIEAWSISMNRLNDTLLHMANRMPFSP